MSDPLDILRPKERRGSKPRCHLLTHGTPEEVAARLTELVVPFGHVTAADRWMPQGFVDLEEAQLHKAPRLIDPERAALLRGWWLAPESQDAMTPNFDIASTCTIGGVPGLLLVEAKAHDQELNKEAIGRSLTDDASDNRRRSHETIGDAIASACKGLSEATSLPCKIARDSCYQMSNRFAWSWKIAELGIPVILVYLGFLRADEMQDRGEPFHEPEDWERLVKAHSANLLPGEVWGREWSCNGSAFISLIRSLEQPLRIGGLVHQL